MPELYMLMLETSISSEYTKNLFALTTSTCLVSASMAHVLYATSVVGKEPSLKITMGTLLLLLESTLTNQIL